MTCVLIYHDVAPAHEQRECGFPGAVAGRYKLIPGDFEAHLSAIAATGLTVGLIETDPAVALTFDDGGASALAVAAALEQRGWAGHFFITTGRIGTQGFLAADAVRELVARGHEVGSHSHTHPAYMRTLSRSEVAREWRRSRDLLGEIIGAVPRTAAVPGGSVSRMVIEEAAGAGYEVLMTSTPTTKPYFHDAMLIQGRYTIWASTPAGRVAAYARGRRWARITTRVGWEAKSASKRVSPAGYEAIRRRLRATRPGPSASPRPGSSAKRS